MMEAFISRKRRKMPEPRHELPEKGFSENLRADAGDDGDEESTDVKLATLASLHPSVSAEALLEALVGAEGSVSAVCQALEASTRGLTSPKRTSRGGVGYQTSLAAFRRPDDTQTGSTSKKLRTLTRKGQTLHLYTPEDIAAHTPCSIIHNILPAGDAEDLLKELLEVAPTFERQTFKLFDNVVQSPHSACFYVDSLEEQIRQKTEYLYNGSYLTVGHCSTESTD